MAYINSHGYAIVDTDPNFEITLQSTHNIKLAIFRKVHLTMI